jgi:hypothetical protein
VTHYYKFCFVREAVEKKEAIARQIQTFYEEKLRDAIPASTYVIDFALLPGDQIIVVELNPFVRSSRPLQLLPLARDRLLHASPPPRAGTKHEPGAV